MAKTEEHCIGRAIRSVVEHVDAVFVVDTGSTDATKAVANKATGSKPFGLRDLPWEGFGKTRTEALKEAKFWTEANTDAAPEDVLFLLLDADDEITSFPDVSALARGPDCFSAVVRSGSLVYPQIKLLRSSVDFIWVGSTHEQLQCVNRDAVVYALPGFEYKIGEDSSRRLSGEKTTGDIELLQMELEEDPANARAWFYLGISYRVVGLYSEAVVAFEERITLQQQDPSLCMEEAYLSMVWSGDSLARAGKNDEAILQWLQAIDYRQHRQEAYTLLAEMFIRAKRPVLATLFASRSLYYENYTSDRLFVDSSCTTRCLAVLQGKLL